MWYMWYIKSKVASFKKNLKKKKILNSYVVSSENFVSLPQISNKLIVRNYQFVISLLLKLVGLYLNSEESQKFIEIQLSENYFSIVQLNKYYNIELFFNFSKYKNFYWNFNSECLIIKSRILSIISQ